MLGVHKVVHSPTQTRYCEYCGLNAPFDAKCKANPTSDTTPSSQTDSVLPSQHQSCCQDILICACCIQRCCPTRYARDHIWAVFIFLIGLLFSYIAINVANITQTQQSNSNAIVFEPIVDGISFAASSVGVVELNLLQFDPNSQVIWASISSD